MNKEDNASFYIQNYFSDYLIKQKDVSSHTIASYRDTFKLLIQYACRTKKKTPNKLKVADLDHFFIKNFLNYLQKQRKCTARSRNHRLSVIKSFYKYLSYEHPEISQLISKVLAIPPKKHENKTVEYLTPKEVEAILSFCDQNKWTGHRDYVLINFLTRTGFRVSEAVNLMDSDLDLGKNPSVHCEGKGRKERRTPLTSETVKLLKPWLKVKNIKKTNYVFPNNRGEKISPDAIQALLRKYVVLASKKKCLSLRKKSVSPHVLRHTTVMDLLHSGVDITVIALWLGHESIETSHVYLKANLELKEKALAKVTPGKSKSKRYKPPSDLLSFLNKL